MGRTLKWFDRAFWLIVILAIYTAIPATAGPENIGKWNAPSATTTLMTDEQLGNLGDNVISRASATVSNQTSLNLYGDCELHLSALTPGSGRFITAYILAAIDGSTFPDHSAATLRHQATQMLTTFALHNTAAAGQRIVVRNLLFPPAAFRVALDNQAGGVLSGQGNTLKCNFYNVNLNG